MYLIEILIEILIKVYKDIKMLHADNFLFRFFIQLHQKLVDVFIYIHNYMQKIFFNIGS